jgi:hypothetical protein
MSVSVRKPTSRIGAVIEGAGLTAGDASHHSRILEAVA